MHVARGQTEHLPERVVHVRAVAEPACVCGLGPGCPLLNLARRTHQPSPQHVSTQWDPDLRSEHVGEPTRRQACGSGDGGQRDMRMQVVRRWPATRVPLQDGGFAAGRWAQPGLRKPRAPAHRPRPNAVAAGLQGCAAGAPSLPSAQAWVRSRSLPGAVGRRGHRDRRTSPTRRRWRRPWRGACPGESQQQPRPASRREVRSTRSDRRVHGRSGRRGACGGRSDRSLLRRAIVPDAGRSDRPSAW